MSDERLPTSDGYVGVPRSKVGLMQILAAVLGAIAIYVVGIVIVGGFDPSLGEADVDDRSDGGLLAAQAVLVLSFILAAIGTAQIANHTKTAEALAKLGLRSAPKRIFSTVGIAIFAYFVCAILILTLLAPEQDDIAENLGAGDDSPVIVTVIAGILIVFGAAFSEEIFFRGLLFGGLRQSLPLWPAALISGLVFGCLHLTAGDVGVAIQLTLFGVILAWTYERTGSMWTPIGLHAANNAIAFTLLLAN